MVCQCPLLRAGRLAGIGKNQGRHDAGCGHFHEIAGFHDAFREQPPTVSRIFRIIVGMAGKMDNIKVSKFGADGIRGDVVREQGGIEQVLLFVHEVPDLSTFVVGAFEVAPGISQDQCFQGRLQYAGSCACCSLAGFDQPFIVYDWPGARNSNT